MAAKCFLLNILIFLFVSGVYSDTNFTFENQCSYPVWLASSPSDGDLDPQMGPLTVEYFRMDNPWKGSIWARTSCVEGTDTFTCETGDCGSGEISCQGPQPKYPVTLLNFDLNQELISYEVSMIHGFNIPVHITPTGGSLVEGGSGACPNVGCNKNLGDVCPPDLVATNKDGRAVGCMSACDALKDCNPNDITKKFEDLCGAAHYYPGDNDPPIYKCNGASSYTITFCPN